MQKKKWIRWKDYSERMIFKNVLGDLTEARKQKIWQCVEAFIDGYEHGEVTGWDSGPAYLCDAVDEALENYLETIWDYKKGMPKENPRYFFNQITIVLRSGIDIVTGRLGGVYGFSISDLRKMYDGKIPRWIARFYGPPSIAKATSDEMIWL